MKFQIHKNLIMIIVAVLALILVSLSAIWVYKYHQVYPKHLINRQKFSEIYKSHTVLGADSVGVISPWMTFDYINHVFNLPINYLENDLSIKDSRYPKLTIIRYARENKLDQNSVATEVQNAVKNYFASSIKQ